MPQPSSSPASSHVDVRAGTKTYRIVVGPGASRGICGLLDAASLPARRFIVSNPTVWRLHSEVFEGITREEPILIPDGERFKNLTAVGRIYDALISRSADRATTIIAVGGGVVGDVAGFAAATYLRGVPVVQVPTTLLAQVDSAIGGKVGVNHALGKNLIGAFHQPALVAADIDLLGTLPRREFRAGLYEVVKYGVIASRDLFEQVSAGLTALFAREPAALLPVITECCRIKGAIVEQDEREAGPRRALNFGHTVGHALEAVTKYRRFRHGEAVAYGMLVAAQIAVHRGVMPETERQALAAVITQMGPLPAVADLAADKILETMAHDKKVVAGQLHFVLPAGIGATTVVTDVTTAELSDALVAIRPS
jgi:3-dehydroquinate synthase